MTLRAKILLAQTPLAAALALIALLAALTNASLGRNAASILQDNYRSVLAVQQMKEALDRLDAATTPPAAPSPGEPRDVAPQLARVRTGAVRPAQQHHRARRAGRDRRAEQGLDGLPRRASRSGARRRVSALRALYLDARRAADAHPGAESGRHGPQARSRAARGRPGQRGDGGDGADRVADRPAGVDGADAPDPAAAVACWGRRRAGWATATWRFAPRSRARTRSARWPATST